MTIRKVLKGLLYLVLFLLLAALALYFWGQHQMEKSQLDPTAVAQHFEKQARRPAFAAADREPCSEHNALGNAYFGELHIHTAYSGDAAAWGGVVTPQQAYDYAKGKPLELRLREDGEAKAPVIQAERALDFVAVTDHAEYMGETSFCLNPDNQYHDTFLCGVYRGAIRVPFLSETMQPMARMASFVLFKDRSARVCGEDGLDCLKRADKVWELEQRAAEEAYDRSSKCSFTSFVAYEYSLAQQGSNLHRNVIFKNATVPPSALSYREAKKPELLWEWLSSSCKDSGTGCDVLAIPHNSNWSSGRMFYPYSLTENSLEEKQRLAALRSRMEPLAEIMQVKGDSECRNGFASVLGAADEYCDFEKLRPLEEETQDCGDAMGSGGMQLQGCLSRFSFVRNAQIEGLREKELLGTNTFKLGVVAATDNHTGAAGMVEEDDYDGSTIIDRNADHRLKGVVHVKGIAKADSTRYNPGGLAGIWASENTREALFDAMQRRETFGTSGPRITPRFFGGWNLSPELCDDQNMIEQAYANGVPMGGDLPQAEADLKKPGFLVHALMDNIKGATPLQKIQIIKGWIDDDGIQHQEVVDVVGDEKPTVSVDTQSCAQSGQGHARLCGVWQDENFDPAQSAVYYARVIENPSCRWTTYDCNSLPESERPASCDNPSVPKTIQERAWTSPIWYNGG